MDKNKKNLAKITFSDGSWCYAKMYGDLPRIYGGIFKKDEKISKYIDWNKEVIIDWSDIVWNNEEVIIDYYNDSATETYKGNINIHGKFDGRGKLTYKDGGVYVGDFRDGKQHGIGTFTNKIGHIYKGNFVYGRKKGSGELTIVNKKTKEPLYTEIYNKNEIYGENGIMESVKYLFEDEGNRYRMTINYDKINRALNKGEINGTEDLRRYITVFDEYGNEIRNYNIIQLVKQCAKYQMQARLINKDGELDDENRMEGGNSGLQNLIILAELVNNIKALNRTRFEIKRNSSRYLKYLYDDIKSFLRSLCLTTDNPPENKQLTSIDTLLSNGVNCICVNMGNTTGNHAVSGIIDLIKLKQFLLKKEKGELKKLSKEELEELEKFIYVYDSSRIIDDPNEGNLGNLQKHCQLFSHVQQKLGSCWYNASCATITAAENPEGIFNKIRRKEILPVAKDEERVNNNTRFNNFEILQMLKLQEVAEDFKVERLGYNRTKRFWHKTRKQELTKAGNRPRMIHQIVRTDVREAVKKMAEGYTGKITFFKKLCTKLIRFMTVFKGKIFGKKVEEYTEKSVLLENLGIKFGMCMSLRLIADKRGLFNEYDRNINETNVLAEEKDEKNKIIKKEQEKLKEIDVKNLEEINERLLDRFKKISCTNDESLLKRATDELNSLTPNTRIELLKRVEKG